MIQSLPELRRQFFAEQKQLYSLPADDPRTPLHYSLEQSKKQAKQLLKALREGALWERIESHPNSAALNPETIKLADAQTILARELGFKSWSGFKHHVESTNIATKAINEGSVSALDEQLRTLHVRCGNDVMFKLAVAGFSGDFLCFADPYIQGPVPADPDLDSFIDIRSDFIAENDWRMREQARKELIADYHALEQARSYDRVAFWFEHDAYDVLVFIKLLHFFSDSAKRPGELQFICVDHYPGVRCFNGIGELPAQSMRLLWQQFRPVEERHLQFGKLCWEAYTSSTPVDWRISLTDFGRELLEGRSCWQAHNRYDRWFGGVHIKSDSGVWYWNEACQTVIESADC